MNIEINHVEGKQKKQVMLYALSTCIWCRKTKMLLNELGISYDYVDVDLLTHEEQERVSEIIKKFNPNAGFPTIVINDSESISGFDERKIREVLADE
ncbi:MAG: glutaredoxin family protein [Actinobacteria bacterium]|nr:glutaredoxin family protein [Actinomycetota bacterium]MCL6088439.1 glutaredoxin family protein [Actinomycetota bacterium]